MTSAQQLRDQLYFGRSGQQLKILNYFEKNYPRIFTSPEVLSVVIDLERNGTFALGWLLQAAVCEDLAVENLVPRAYALENAGVAMWENGQNEQKEPVHEHRPGKAAAFVARRPPPPVVMALLPEEILRQLYSRRSEVQVRQLRQFARILPELFNRCDVIRSLLNLEKAYEIDLTLLLRAISETKSAEEGEIIGRVFELREVNPEAELFDNAGALPTNVELEAAMSSLYAQRSEYQVGLLREFESSCPALFQRIDSVQALLQLISAPGCEINVLMQAVLNEFLEPGEAAITKERLLEIGNSKQRLVAGGSPRQVPNCSNDHLLAEKIVENDRLREEIESVRRREQQEKAKAKMWSTVPFISEDGSYRIYTLEAAAITSAANEDTNQFNIAFAHFLRLLKDPAKVVKRVDVIEYSMDSPVRSRYLQQQQQFENLPEEASKEIWVFHGTSPSAMLAIVQDGFKVGGKDGGVKVINGSSYGKAVYTATGPLTPIGYSKASTDKAAAKPVEAPKPYGDQAVPFVVSPNQGVILARALLGKTGKWNGKGVSQLDSWIPRDDWMLFKEGSQLLPCYLVYYE